MSIIEESPLDLTVSRSAISVIQETKPLFIQTNIDSLITPINNQSINPPFNYQSAAGLLQRALLKPLSSTTIQSDHGALFSDVSHLRSVTPRKGPNLPQCAAPGNLNSNWIAMKFGAAVGQNRMSYPREFKLMVIDFYYQNGQNKYRTCKEFQITKSMLNGWLAKLEKIKESRPGSLKSGRSGRRPQFPDIERQLYELYKESLVVGQKIGNRWIRDTARTLAQKQCSAEQLGGMCQFSERWLSNFKKRYRINLNRDWLAINSNGGADSSSTASSTNEQTVANGSSTSAQIHNLPSEQVSHSNDLVTSNMPMDEAPSDTSSSYPTELSDSELSHSARSSPQPITINEAASYQTQPINYTINAKSHSVTRQLESAMPMPPVSDYKPFANGRNPLMPSPTGSTSQLLPASSREGHVTPTCFEPGRRGRKVQFPQVERVLYKRLMERQSLGQRLSNRWMQEQARSIAAQLCPQVLAEATKSARCMFSEHWLHNFKKRYNVTLKCPTMTESRLIETEPLNHLSSLTPVNPLTTQYKGSDGLNHLSSLTPVNPLTTQYKGSDGPIRHLFNNRDQSADQQQLIMSQMQQWLLQQALLNSAFTPPQPPNQKNATALSELYQSLLAQRQRI